MRRPAFVLLIFTLACAAVAHAEESGATNSPDSSGRLHFTEADLPKDEKDPAGLSEIDEVAQRRGLNYAKTTRRAARGDAKALKQFFALADDVDGAAAESYRGMPTVVYHIAGDEKFAKFLAAQPEAFQIKVRNTILSEGLPAPAKVYFPRYFPETSKLLFRREIVGWPSPDRRFAIRKVFSDEFDMLTSKVERAELIEQQNGQVLLDLTSDDIGTGGDREGEVLWSPDSKRLAYQSSDMTIHEGNLFDTPQPPPRRKQTAVYQLSGDTLARVDLSWSVPGRDSDEELKGAKLGHDYIEPVRWQKPNVLLLERHEYYQKLGPTEVEGMKFESIKDFARWYRISATIAPDGKATLVWKVRKED